jgi:hypothetical protein
VVQRPLRQELNILVDGEHQVLARLGFVLARSQHVAARVHGRVHAAGNPMQPCFVFLLQAAQAVVVRAHIAQHLRGDLVIWVEALKLFLEVNALDGKCFYARRHIRRDAARDPGKTVPGNEAGGNLLFRGLVVVRVGVDQGGQGMRGGLLVVDLGGNGVDGIDLHGHGQFAQVAVEKHAAPRSDLKGALLLLLGALLELVVAHHLQPEQAEENGAHPKQKKQADQPEAPPLERHDQRRIGAIAVGSNC